jgi:hypothetical protein
MLSIWYELRQNRGSFMKYLPSFNHNTLGWLYWSFASLENCNASLAQEAQGHGAVEGKCRIELCGRAMTL